MKIEKAIDNLRDYINKKYKETKNINTIRTNIMVRGHLRSLSTEIEDGIAFFLLDILPNGYKAFVDASVRVGSKTHRPDILIIDDRNNVKALVEVKTNMGWCRNASKEIDKILEKHVEMSSKENVICKFSNNPEVEVSYSKDVPVYLVAFTSKNCGDSQHEDNRDKANAKNVKYHCLFSGWYDEELEPLEINTFAEELIVDLKAINM